MCYIYGHGVEAWSVFAIPSSLLYYIIPFIASTSITHVTITSTATAITPGCTIIFGASLASDFRTVLLSADTIGLYINKIIAESIQPFIKLNGIIAGTKSFTTSALGIPMYIGVTK